MKIVNNELDILSDWFKANRLSLNIKKTNYMMFGYKNLPVQCPINKTEFSISVDDLKITEVEYTKFLGVLIDKKFTWQKHVSFISNKIAKSIYVINRLKYKLSSDGLLALYFSLIYPNLVYCNIIWGCAAKSILNKLFILQKRAVRIINKCGYLTHTDLLFKKLNFLKIFDLHEQCCVLFVYKFKNNYLPLECDPFLTINTRADNEVSYSLRFVNDFTIPFARTTIRERCISVRGPKIWSKFDEEIRNSASISILKKNIRKFFINKY